MVHVNAQRINLLGGRTKNLGVKCLLAWTQWLLNVLRYIILFPYMGVFSLILIYWNNKNSYSIVKISQTLFTQEFPPASKLDPTVYGNQKSTIKEEHILKNLEGFTVLKVNKQIEGNNLYKYKTKYEFSYMNVNFEYMILLSYSFILSGSLQLICGSSIGRH